MSALVFHLPLACFQSAPHRAWETTYKMFHQVTRLPCLKLPFTNRKRSNPGSWSPGSCPVSPPHQSVQLPLAQPWGLCTQSCVSFRVSAFTVPLAQGTLPTTRTLLKCHLCRTHLVGTRPWCSVRAPWCHLLWTAHWTLSSRVDRMPPAHAP